MVINGVTKLSYALSIYRETKNFLSILGSIFIIVFGITLIFNPFEGAKGLIQIIGIALIVYSVLDLVESIIISIGIKGKADPSEGKIIEAEFKEKEDK